MIPINSAGDCSRLALWRLASLDRSALFIYAFLSVSTAVPRFPSAVQSIAYLRGWQAKIRHSTEWTTNDLQLR
jgi:hypothetical protein